MAYALATLNVDREAVPAIEVGSRWYDLRSVAPEIFEGPLRTLITLFAQWERCRPQLAAVAERLQAGGHDPLGALRPDDFLTPLQFPKKLILCRANYYDHLAKDMGNTTFRKEDSILAYFMKPPSTTLVGCGKTVRYPWQSEQLDWEVELAVVIGREAHRVSVAEAAMAIAGYATAIDLSARDLQLNPRHPFKVDLFGGKVFDTSCPLGPKIVPAEFVNDGELQLRLSVNGELKQDGNTSDMVWSPAEVISSLSELLTLEPGDVILTGTPSGVGFASGTYLQRGDRVVASISGLGELGVETI
jgi:2-keto-4-pentenoate hydratase/2-oxohepta-3-ene-1,7-dioic acid hydratase in catechol pathway